MLPDMSPQTLLRTCSTLGAHCFLVAALAVALGAPGAAAASRDRHHMATQRVHHAYAAHRWHHVARGYPPLYGDAGIPPGAIVGPGYVFVPGRGILGEDCDMPTSTCTNEYRDVQ